MHGLIEEVIGRFRESSAKTCDGVKNIAERVNRGEEEANRLKAALQEQRTVVKDLEIRLKNQTEYSVALEEKIEFLLKDSQSRRRQVEEERIKHENSLLGGLVVATESPSTEILAAPSTSSKTVKVTEKANYNQNVTESVNHTPFSYDSSKGKQSQQPKQSHSPIDKHLAAKRLLRRFHTYVVDNGVDVRKQRQKMDVNKDGFLSFDELVQALKVFEFEISIADALVLFKYMGSDSEIISLQTFFDLVENPPVIEKRKVDVKKAKSAISYIDIDSIKPLSPYYDDHGVQEIEKTKTKPLLPQRKLGDMATNPARRRSLGFREVGWNTHHEKTKAETFGNVFEATSNYETGEVRERNNSTFMYSRELVDLAGKASRLPPCSDDVVAIFKKISSYIKGHKIILDEAIRQMDVDNDGRLSQQELKLGISQKLGIHMSAAEIIFLYRYLAGAGDGSYADLETFKLAILAHKPAHGKLR